MMQIVALVCLGLLGMAQAQSLRDPTVAPDAVGSAGSASNAANAGSGLGGQGDQGDQGGRAFTIIIRNGKLSVVVGTRLFVEGQKLGGETIDRITETEVWLRTGRVVRKVPQFPGIERHAPSAQPCSLKKNAPRVASCANDQP